MTLLGLNLDFMLKLNVHISDIFKKAIQQLTVKKTHRQISNQIRENNHFQIFYHVGF